MTEQLQLFVPDRFDMLQRRAPSQLDSIVVPVDTGLARIRTVHRDMSAAGRGAFLVFRGDSGCGKSTFLGTLGMFLSNTEVAAIRGEDPIGDTLAKAGPTTASLRVIIIEGRDALKEVSPQVLESAIHSINSFVRSANGERTLVVWPANADDLESALVATARRVGADSLLGVDESSYRFPGPPKEQYLDIASRTIATLNQGAGLADLGVSAERAQELSQKATTVGQFLGLLRRDLLQNQSRLDRLLEKERCRMWIVVAAANDPEGDIAGLTRGALSSVDVERLISATKANVVQELKRFPDKLGILGAVLDAKILHLPSVTALAIARDYADERLQTTMSQRNLSVSGKGDATARLAETDLARAFSQKPMGTRTRGPKPGSNTEEAFRKLADIASASDPLLNGAIGRALQGGGYITSFATEKDLGTGLSRRTDVACQAADLGVVRLEIMWRQKAGRAEIANYVLTKLFNYGRAIGFLDGGS